MVEWAIHLNGIFLRKISLMIEKAEWTTYSLLNKFISLLRTSLLHNLPFILIKA
jgi:hypothetical protein